MRALLVLTVGLVIVAAQSENSKFTEELRKNNKNIAIETGGDPLVASGSDKVKKEVTIKKHKNYEIVLYEYEDSSEDNDNPSDENDNKGKNKFVAKSSPPPPDFTSDDVKIDSIVPAWNPVKIPPPEFVPTTTSTTTTTTTTRRPTTTTERTTTTQRTTTTRRPTTTTTTTEAPKVSVVSPAEESGEDSGDYYSDEANKVIRPFTKPQDPVQIRPFNPLQQLQPEEGSEGSESEENGPLVASPSPPPPSPKPKIKNIANSNRKVENTDDVPIPKVKVHKGRKTATSTTTAEPPPPPPPENIFTSDSQESYSDEEISPEVSQQIARQKGSRKIAKPPKDSEEQVFVSFPITENPQKTKGRFVTPIPQSRKGGVVSVEEVPTSRPKSSKSKPNGKRPTQQPDSFSGSDEDDYSDSHGSSPRPKTNEQDPSLRGLVKPNYNIPKPKNIPSHPGHFSGVEHHPLNKPTNKQTQPANPSDSSGDEYSTSSSDEDFLPNSRRPITRPEDVPRNKPTGRPHVSTFTWRPPHAGTPRTDGRFRPPTQVIPGNNKGDLQGGIQFVSPSDVPPLSPNKSKSQKNFRPPVEVPDNKLPKNDRFLPPSEVPESITVPLFPRFNSSTRPAPVRPSPPNSSGSSESSSSESVEHDESLACKDPTGKKGICQEYYKCSILYSNMIGKINLQEYKCPLPTQVGICCPITERNAKSRKLMEMVNTKDMHINSQVSKLIRHNLPSSFAFGDNWVDEMEEIERELLAKSVTVKRDTPAFGHHRFFPTSKKIRDVSHIGFSLLQTSNDLSERLQLTNEVGGIGLKSFKSSNIEALTDRCPSEPFCPRRKYRTIDGTCNNLGKPKLGGSLTPLSRVLSPAYADGRWEPRRSVQGFDLPSPRLLSQQFIPDHDVPNTRFTLYTMQFGQFVDHDISSVPMFTFGNNSGIDCCQNGQFQPRHLMHPNCFPIDIPRDDPFYSRFNQRCMNMVRSRMAPRIDCSLGYADQMNALTHWLDASNVYGSNEEEGRELRSFNRGFLRFSTVPGSKIWLPLKPTGNSREIDYKAGDDRVNEMQGLMITHMVWFREHNRLADELSRLNPNWNDEQLYQESRRILIAEYQHVIYNEWLPIIIGRDYMDTYGILPLNRDYYKDYDPSVDSSVENSFSAAAFRMGHTLVQGVVRLVNQFGQNDEGVAISQHAENAIRTHAAGQVDKWIRGLVQQPVQNYDPFISQHLNGRLFQGKNSQFGMDLSSLNIQRGRDHGIPGYNAYRELCQTGIKATSFDDFNDWIPKEMIDKMKRHYVDVDDVDLWIGGLSETPLPGALIGPTFTCIIGDQFARSKKGDRYFYDIGEQPHSFTKAQLDEIRKASFARILCDNSDNLEAVQPSAFLLPDFDFNALVDCERSNRIPRLDLRAWINEPTP